MFAVVSLIGLVGLAACGGEEEPELTFEDRLAEVEGRPMTPVELAKRAEAGELLCRLDDQILDEVWQRLDDDELAFHDIVIISLCPDRAILYAGHTGRFVTEQAEQSGVRTSTTRPTSTTTTSRPSITSPPRPPFPLPSNPSTTDTGSSSSASNSTSSASTTSRVTGTTTIIPASEPEPAPGDQ